MTEAVLLKIGVIIAVLVGYGLVRWRIMIVTHEFRGQAGCDADRWAADERVPANLRQSLQDLADRMYRPTTPWLIVLGTLIFVLMPYRQFDRKHDAMMRSISSDVREDVARLSVRLVFAGVATSPLATIATILILLAGLVIRTSVASLERRIEAIAGTYASWSGLRLSS